MLCETFLAPVLPNPAKVMCSENVQQNIKQLPYRISQRKYLCCLLINIVLDVDFTHWYTCVLGSFHKYMKWDELTGSIDQFKLT